MGTRKLSERDSFWTWRDGDSITFLENTITKNGERFEVVPEGTLAALEAEWNRLRAALDERCVCEEGHRCGFCAALEEGGDDV